MHDGEARDLDLRPRVLITGAAGFLGRELVRQASAGGWKVRATDRAAMNPVPGAESAPADILNPASLPEVMAGVNLVIHAAGLAHVFNLPPGQENRFRQVNTDGTSHVARAAAAAGTSHFLLISSVAVYGDPESEADEDWPCRPLSPYARSKWEAEQRAADAASAHGMNVTILRLATLYGEEDPGNIRRLVQLIHRRRFVWVGDGTNRKSLLHRADAARACLEVLRRPASGIRIYNVAAPPCTMYDVVAGIAAALGRGTPRLRVPAAVVSRAAGVIGSLAGGRGRLGTLPALVRKWLADDVFSSARFDGAFNYRPGITLQEGLQREVRWFLSSLSSPR